MKASIKIRAGDWTGWQPGQPEPTEKVVEVAPGDHLEQHFPHNFFEVVVTVRLINKEVVLLESWKLAPEQPGGGIDLMTNFSGLQSRLKKDQHATLRTQTMDGGTSYTFTVIDIMES